MNIVCSLAVVSSAVNIDTIIAPFISNVAAFIMCLPP